jgi:defect-in-organelle-trafficking protein DotD
MNIQQPYIHKKRWMLFICSSLLLSGCAATPMMKKPPMNAPSDDASIKIAEAATSISHSMMAMARVEKVILPKETNNIVNIPSSYQLQTRATVDWNGPVEEVLERIAYASHFRLRTLGTPPSVPILVNLNIKDQSLAEILRNVDYQAGNKAMIHVYPDNQVIELRYAKFDN